MTQTKTIAAARAAREKTPQKPACPAKTTTPKSTKSDAVVALLSRPEGVTIEAIMKVTGWQAHSARGFLAGTVKKKLGKTVSSEKTGAGRVYRIVEQAAE